MRRSIRPIMTAVAAVILVMAAAAHATFASRPSSVPSGVEAGPNHFDFNNDGFDDLAIGAPFDDVNGQKGAGVVNVIYGSAHGLDPALKSQVWSQASPNVATRPEAGDHFGWALASGDFDGDGYADLAIGVPGEDLPGKADVGGVNVLMGSPQGLRAESGQHLVTFDDLPVAPTGAQFGYALAAGDLMESHSLGTPGEPDNVADLAVGGPGLGSGWVCVVGGRALVHDEAAPLAIACGHDPTGANGDRFGQTIVVGQFDANEWDDLVIGIPGRDVVTGPNTTVTNAGALYYWLDALHGDDGVIIAQGDVELGDQAETGDRLGEALAVGRFDSGTYDELVVGVPHEDLTAGADAGLVEVLSMDSTGSGAVVGHVRWTEDSPGVPGTARTGDLFGAALATGNFEASDALASLAIGVPGATVHGHAHAGAVVVIYSDGPGLGLGTTNNDRWTQDSASVRDAAETKDRFGRSLFRGDFDGDFDADLAIGVPTEDVGSIKNAGAVSVLYCTTPGGLGLTANGDDFWSQDSNGVGETAQQSDWFGFALR